MSTPLTDFGATAKALDAVTVQVDYAGGDVDGESIDRIPGGGQRYLSALFFLSTVDGSASDEVVATLYESDDDSTYTAATDDAGNAITLTCNDAADFAEVDVDLKGLKRYVRLELDTGDQTVDSSIDLYAGVTLAGATAPPVD